MEDSKACCFIGHGKIEDKENVFLCVKKAVEKMIIENGVKVFIFGSRSEFDDICHLAVTQL